MNFTYVSRFVVVWDVVRVFPVSSSSFVRKTTGRNRAQSHSGAWRGLKTKWDLKLSLPSPTYLIDTCLSKSEQQLPSSSSTLSSSDSSGARISSHFRIQVRSADECVAPRRRQPQETPWTSDGRLSSPETNLKVGLLPLFFMQLLLSHMFLSFMVRTSTLMFIENNPWTKKQQKRKLNRKEAAFRFCHVSSFCKMKRLLRTCTRFDSTTWNKGVLCTVIFFFFFFRHKTPPSSPFNNPALEDGSGFNAKTAKAKQRNLDDDVSIWLEKRFRNRKLGS